MGGLRLVNINKQIVLHPFHRLISSDFRKAYRLRHSFLVTLAKLVQIALNFSNCCLSIRLTG